MNCLVCGAMQAADRSVVARTEQQLALAMRDADRMHEQMMAETALGKA